MAQRTQESFSGQGRKTTLPQDLIATSTTNAGASAGPPAPSSGPAPATGGRTMAGPPPDGADRITKILVDETDDVYLTTVSEEQMRADRADRFPDETDYVQRVAKMIALWPKLFLSLLFTPKDLLDRLARLNALGVLRAQVEGFLTRIVHTENMEWSDVLRMCDLVVTDLELQMRRPTLSEKERAQLAEVAAGPIAVWQERQKRRQRTELANRKLREEQREEVLAAEARAEAAEAREQIRAGQPVSLPLSKSAPAPAPGRRARRR